MSAKSRYLSLPLLIATGLAGAACTAIGSESQDAPLRCAIDVSEQGGMVSLQGVVKASAAIEGTYRFSVESAGGSGNSRIKQGGGFSAAPGETVKLGRVMLSANGIYDASLELDTSAGSVECEEQAGRL
jgi:hypothetical protein